MYDYAALYMAIQEYDPNRKRANHLLKVDGYASIIGRWEGLNREELSRLRLAALLHDIGVKTMLERRDAGEPRGVDEGPAIARNFLRRLGCPEEVVARVCHLVEHHHDYDRIDGRDFQILVESDFIVNCDERGVDRDEVLRIRERHFKTAAGARVLSVLFDL